MLAEVEYAEYLTEIQEQVCGYCPEHEPDQPRCQRCGIELQLPHLVEAIHDADGEPRRPGAVLDRRAVAAACVCPGGPTWLRQAGSWIDRVVWAVESVDERREQRELVRRRAPRPVRNGKVPVAAMIQAYEEATGTCLGCD